MRIVVIGGGILGLATARELLRADPAAEVVVLERERELARHQTSHNSGVVHAGIYYEPGSLKARLCRRGLGLMRDFCAAHDLPYDACGKLIVATKRQELDPLNRLAERASANGVPGLRWLDHAQLTEIEPHAVGVAALHSPETAITDFARVAAAMAADARAAGARIETSAEVTRVLTGSRVTRVELRDGTELSADRVIACAGVQIDRLARASGEPASPRIIPFRGEYWLLRGERAELVRGLIYPVPDPRLPFLGVHLTKRTDGAVLLGPNAVLALGRGDIYATFSWPGTWRMFARHWRAGVSELARAASKRRFIADVQRYVPAIEPRDTVRAPAGIRAQAIDRDGTLVDDFRLASSRGVLWVRNAPSPAATSSIAIAEELAERSLRG